MQARPMQAPSCLLASSSSSSRLPLCCSSGWRLNARAPRHGALRVPARAVQHDEQASSSSREQASSSGRPSTTTHPPQPRSGLTSPPALASVLALGAIGAGQFNSQPLFIAEALGVLAAIIAVHEAGHFAAARLQGIHVTKFAIGFGPALVKFKRGAVEYSLRAIPLGGYVAFPDDDPNSPFAKDDPNLLSNKPIASRAAVISAGVLANVAFAYLTLLLQVGVVGKAETSYLPGVQIPSLAPTSLAATSGLRAGDVIVGVDAVRIGSEAGEVSHVVDLIRASPNRPMAFTVQRAAQAPALADTGAPSASAAPSLTARGQGGAAGSSGAALVRVVVTPEGGQDGVGRIGVRLTPNTRIEHTRPKDTAELVAIANSEFVRLSTSVLVGLKNIITNFLGVAGQLSGPVAIVAAGSEIAKTDAAGLFQFCAIININLAVVNTLPLPALDGGYMLLLAVEALRGGKKLPEKFEQTVMASGALLLMAMGVSLVVKDTLNLIS